MMVYVTRSQRQNCPHDTCAVHRGNRKLGQLHAAGELVIPKPGDLQAQVVRVWDDNGYRSAHMDVFDRRTQTWTLGLPLPPRPREAHAAAVGRARAFVRTGVLVP